jgi:hypothetical protein
MIIDSFQILRVQGETDHSGDWKKLKNPPHYIIFINDNSGNMYKSETLSEKELFDLDNELEQLKVSPVGVGVKKV